jgi:Ku70/Ku80 beta-barrel domain
LAWQPLSPRLQYVLLKHVFDRLEGPSHVRIGFNSRETVSRSAGERVRLHYVHRPEPAEPSAIVPMSTRGTESAKPEPLSPRFEPAPAKVEPEMAPPPTPVTRVRQSLITTGDEQPISRADILHGYEVEPDQYVVFDRDELRGLQRRTSPNMEIVRSVRLSEIDPVFFETSYYLVPDRGSEKAYALLFEALCSAKRNTSPSRGSVCTAVSTS